MKVKFGVITDLHTEFIHDAKNRFDKFIDACKKENVDFCIELGDFCPPGETNIQDKSYILSKIKSNSIPFYHVLGNHDMDKNCKADVLNALELSDSHTSFNVGGVHFICLDACFYKQDGKFYDYDHANYVKVHDAGLVPFLPPSELDWLKADLKKTILPSVIFTHQSLIESRAGIKNPEQLRKIISRSPNGVLLAICGHEHVDRLEKKDNTYYYCVNSASYYWAGSKYTHSTYDKQITLQYPHLEHVFPYSDALFCIIEISDKSIKIKGSSAKFVGATPKQLNFEKEGLRDPITTTIIDREIRL